MNRQRRKTIEAVKKRIEDTLADAITDLESVKDEEEEALENLPESLQDSDQAETMREAVSALENAISALEDLDIEDSLDEAVSL
jgi:hypothetical protein